MSETVFRSPSDIPSVLGEIKKNFDLLFSAKIPVEKHFIKKNGRPVFIHPATKKPFIGKSKELRQAEQYLTLALRSAANKIGVLTPITGPLWVTFLFVYKREDFFTKDGKPKKRIGDLSNLYELPQDCLAQAGIIEDDDQICAHDLSRKLPGEKTVLEVFIFQHKQAKKPIKVSKTTPVQA